MENKRFLSRAALAATGKWHKIYNRRTGDTYIRVNDVSSWLRRSALENSENAWIPPQVLMNQLASKLEFFNE